MDYAEGKFVTQRQYLWVGTKSSKHDYCGIKINKCYVLLAVFNVIHITDMATKIYYLAFN